MTSFDIGLLDATDAAHSWSGSCWLHIAVCTRSGACCCWIGFDVKIVVGCISAVGHVIQEWHTSHAVVAKSTTPSQHTGRTLARQAVLHTMSNWSPGTDGCHPWTAAITACRATWAADDVGSTCTTGLAASCTGLYSTTFSIFCWYPPVETSSVSSFSIAVEAFRSSWVWSMSQNKVTVYHHSLSQAVFLHWCLKHV